MQTFLPYPDFQKSVQHLDNKRLGKQRVEALQILNVLEGKSKGWKNHPAVKMWKGHEFFLHLYKDYCITEWVRRGFKNNMPLTSHLLNSSYAQTRTQRLSPPWLTEEFCESHRSNLLRKDPVHYGQFGWDCPDDLSYIWPIK